MHDFACIDPDKMNYKLLADKTRYFKEDMEGVTSMCKAVEELCNQERLEGIEQGIEQGMEQARMELIINNLKKGKSCETVAEIFDIPVEDVQKIKDTIYQ